MTQIMIAHEKYGPRYIDMSKGNVPTAMALLVERYNAGLYNDDANEKARAEKAASGADPRFAPWHFLASHRDYEYERVEIVTLEEIAA